MNISEIIKGGSRGQGTALADKSDLDLVAYSRGETSVIYVHVYYILYSIIQQILILLM